MRKIIDTPIGRARHSVRAAHDIATNGAHGVTRPTKDEICKK
ncbi:MAG: hypothetical protein ABI042_16080 [Verrucomicrobiota bacterium]